MARGTAQAYDPLMAESGLSSITGSPHAAGRAGVSLVDIATGQFATRHPWGVDSTSPKRQGARLNRLFGAVAHWLAVPYLLDRYGAAAPQRVGLAHPGICPYGVFTAQCGQDFVLSIQNEREWQRLCEVGIARTDLLADARCVDNPTITVISSTAPFRKRLQSSAIPRFRPLC